jgi:hypothetical protein
MPTSPPGTSEQRYLYMPRAVDAHFFVILARTSVHADGSVKNSPIRENASTECPLDTWDE